MIAHMSQGTSSVLQLSHLITLLDVTHAKGSCCPVADQGQDVNSCFGLLTLWSPNLTLAPLTPCHPSHQATGTSVSTPSHFHQLLRSLHSPHLCSPNKPKDGDSGRGQLQVCGCVACHLSLAW